MLKPLCVKFVCDYSYFKYFFRWNKLLFGESSNLYVVSVVPPNDPSHLLRDNITVPCLNVNKLYQNHFTYS